MEVGRTEFFRGNCTNQRYSRQKRGLVCDPWKRSCSKSQSFHSSVGLEQQAWPPSLLWNKEALSPRPPSASDSAAFSPRPLSPGWPHYHPLCSQIPALTYSHPGLSFWSWVLCHGSGVNQCPTWENTASFLPITHEPFKPQGHLQPQKGSHSFRERMFTEVQVLSSVPGSDCEQAGHGAWPHEVIS